MRGVEQIISWILLFGFFGLWVGGFAFVPHEHLWQGMHTMKDDVIFPVGSCGGKLHFNLFLWFISSFLQGEGRWYYLFQFVKETSYRSLVSYTP